MTAAGGALTSETGRELSVSAKSVSLSQEPLEPLRDPSRFLRRGTAAERPDMLGASTVASPRPQTEADTAQAGGWVASSADRVDSFFHRTAPADYSPTYRRLRVYHFLKEASDALDDFERTLGMTESAVHMQLFRSALDDLWKFIPSDQAYFARAVAAVRSSIRFTKWRQFARPQVSMLQRSIKLLTVSGGELDGKGANHIYSVLHGGSLDVFPSAGEEEEEEESTTLRE